MSTLVFSTVGSTLSISAGVPATIDSSGFGALTYTEIKEITSIGMIGGDTAIIDHMPVNHNAVYKLKGTRQPGSLSLKGGFAPTDPGQILARAGDNATAAYAVKLVLQNGTIFYSQGLINGFKVGVEGQSAITAMEVNIALSGPLVIV